MQFCVDLRRLQDGGAHLLRGFDNFSEYVQAQIDADLKPSNVKQLSRMGHVLLVLERHKRISLDGRGLHRKLGTTGVRALSGVLGKHGEQTMLAIFDRVVATHPDRTVSDKTVKAVERDLLHPQTPALEPAHAHEEPAEPAPWPPPEEEEPLPEEQSELVSQLLDDLGSFGAWGDDMRKEINALMRGDERPIELAPGAASRAMLDATLLAADTGRAMSQENVEIVRRFLVVDDFDEALTYADPGIVWNPVEESSAQGHDAVRASTARWKGEWDDYELIPEEFADVGDRVVVTVRFRARGRGSGVEVDARLYDVFTLRDGMIVRMDQFAERSEALEALGLSV